MHSSDRVLLLMRYYHLIPTYIFFLCTDFRTSPGRRREISVMTMAESQVRNYPYAPMDVSLIYNRCMHGILLVLLSF